VKHPDQASARYRFGDAAPVGLLLGMPARQAAPLVVGVLWLTLALMAQLPLIGIPGPVIGAIAAFGRIRGVPLYEAALPAARAVTRRKRVWTRPPVLGGRTSPTRIELPPALSGLELVEHSADWLPSRRTVAVVRDRSLDTVSVVVPVSAEGFSVASLVEQDGIVEAWGATLGPLARAKCAVSRVTWQDWCRPTGVAGHRAFLDSLQPSEVIGPARSDYELLLDSQDPFTISHEVLLTLTVELRRVRARRGRSQIDSAMTALLEETRTLRSRLESAGMSAGDPLDVPSLSEAIRMRSNPVAQAGTSRRRRSLAATARRVAGEWGPMAMTSSWTHARVDASFHRSFVVTRWPMLPVAADWLGPLLTGDTATRTVTLVLEPVSIARASLDANRHLTSIEADHEQKERHGFRLTARERRRQNDVESRERELAEGHPEFRFVGIVTVSATTEEALDDASADVELAAAQSLIELRPLAARQEQGWVASLPLGRSVRNGGWL
jgi:hypothetical protein